MTRVVVDQARCQGHARCLTEAPEIFGYDDATNKAFVLEGADVEQYRDTVLYAVQGCPEAAIALKDDPGPVESAHRDTSSTAGGGRL